MSKATPEVAPVNEEFERRLAELESLCDALEESEEAAHSLLPGERRPGLLARFLNARPKIN